MKATCYVCKHLAVGEIEGGDERVWKRKVCGKHAEEAIKAGYAVRRLGEGT